MELPRHALTAAPPFPDAKPATESELKTEIISDARYDRYLQILGAGDLDLRSYPIKFILLNILKKEGLPVPDGILVNLKPFYETLLDIFQQDRHAIGQYLKIVANEMQFADTGKIDKDMIIHELLNIGNAQFSYLIKDIEAVFQHVRQHLQEPHLILRGGDDDVDDQAGKTTSIVIRDFLLAAFDVLAGYTHHADILERSQHVDIILPFSKTLTDQYFFTHEMTGIETNLMVSLAQRIADTKHAGTISVDDKFVHIEFSEKRFYHENSLAPTHTLFFNRQTSVLEGLDPVARRFAERTIVKKNCYELIQLSEKTKRNVQKINPLFNKLLLEVCLNLDEDPLMPAIVQVKTIYSPFNEIVNPKSGIFQIRLDPKQYLNKSTKFSCHGIAYALEKPQDIALLTPESIAVLKIEDWQNIQRFPYFPLRNRPRIILTNGGSVGMHLITQLKMYGENVARIHRDDFQPLFEIARANKIEACKNKGNAAYLTEVRIERDHREGKFGRMNWKCYQKCKIPPGFLSELTSERIKTDPEFGNYRDWEIRKTLDLQETLNHPADFVNPDAELLPFSVSIDDEEGDGVRLFKGNYIQFTIRAVHKKSISEVLQNAYECDRFWTFLSEVGEDLGNDWLNIHYRKTASRIIEWIDSNHADLKAALLEALEKPKATLLRILEVEKNTYGVFTGMVLDVTKYQHLSTRHVIDLIFRSGVTFNLIITADAVNACNHLSTHFILRAVFKGNETAIRGSTAEGRVGYADSWNGLYEYYPREEYLADIGDILNSLYTLKSLGLDPCFEVKYIQRWMKSGRYRISRAILKDDRFEDKVLLPIIDYVILPVRDTQGVINTMIPFEIYQHCLELLDYKKAIPDSKLLWETIKRYFNYDALKTGTPHHIVQADEKWMAHIVFPGDIPDHLEYLLIVIPGSARHPLADPGIVDALKILGTISRTTPFAHDPPARRKSAVIRNLVKRKCDISEAAYRKLRLIQPADEPEAVSADTYFNRHVVGLKETIKVSRLLLDRVYQIETQLMYAKDFDTCLRNLAASFLERFGFRRFEYFELTAGNQTRQAVSRLALEISLSEERDGNTMPAAGSSCYDREKPIVPDGILASTLREGACLYINPDVEHIPVELEFETPFITTCISNRFGQPMGVIKVDSVSFTLNTLPNYKYILNILKPYVFVLEALGSCLTFLDIDPVTIPLDLGREKALSFEKNRARKQVIDKLSRLLLNPPETFESALNTAALKLMRYPYNFKQIKIFSYDPETRIVLSDRKWRDKNPLPGVNTESSFWNKGMGRHLKTGEIFWESLVHNKPVVVLNPATDPRCNTLKYRFMPTGPCIVAPLGGETLIGFIKLEGYPAGKGDISLAKSTIRVDRLDIISRMEQSLYEKAKSIQNLTQQDYPVFHKMTRARLIESALAEFNRACLRSAQEAKSTNIGDTVQRLLKELKNTSVEDTATLSAVIRTLSRIASAVINNRDIIHAMLAMLSSPASETVIVRCLEALLVYCHVSDVDDADKKMIYQGVTRFYLDKFDAFHDKPINFNIKNTILRTLVLLHPLADVAWNAWMQFFTHLAGRDDDPEIIARVINCIVTFVMECSAAEATLPCIEQIETIAAHNEANQKNKYEAWGYLGPRPEVPPEMTRIWADEMIEHLGDITEYHDEAILISESIITALGNLYAADKIDPHQKQLIHFKLLTGLRRKDIRYKHFVLATVGEICKNSLLDMKTRHALMDQVMLMLQDASEMIRTRAASILVTLAGEHMNYLIASLGNAAFAAPRRKDRIEKLWYVLSCYRKNRKFTTPAPSRNVWLREAAEKPAAQVGYKGLGLGALIRETVPIAELDDIPASDRRLLTRIHEIFRGADPAAAQDLSVSDVIQKMTSLCFTPEGKIIETQVFHAFIRQTGLIDILPDRLPDKHDADAAALRQRLEFESGAIETYFRKARMPEEIIDMLERDRTKLIYRGSSQGIEFRGITLRSASDEEDSARHAAAGRFSSYHNLNSMEKIVEHLKYVWASAWSPEARLHRHFLSATKKATDINMAVIMQLMVPDVKISGVIFVKRSRHGNGFDTEINAGFGLAAGTRSDDNTDYYALKDSSIEIFKDISRQNEIIMPSGDGDTIRIPVPPVKGREQKLSDPEILCLAFVCRRLTRELLKPRIAITLLKDMPEVRAHRQTLFPGQDNGIVTLRDEDEIKKQSARLIQDSAQQKQFQTLVETAFTESRKRIGIDFEFAITESGRIALLQQREITADLPRHTPQPVRFNHHHKVSLATEPFVYGCCIGEILLLREQDTRERAEILTQAEGRILIAEHLDERNLDQFISSSPPLGVIVSTGSKNAHIVIEAREYFQKKKIAIPVVKLQNAPALFDGIPAIGIVAAEQHVDLFFEEERHRNLFTARLEVRAHETQKPAESHIPFEIPANPEELTITEIPEDWQGLMDLLPVESALFNDLTQNNDQQNLTRLFFINRARKQHMEAMFQGLTENEIFMDYEDARLFYTWLAESCHADPAGSAIAEIKSKINSLFSKYGYDTALDDIFHIAATLFHFHQRFENACRLFEWMPGILHFYTIDFNRKVTAARRIFIINPRDGEIVDESPDAFKITHAGLVPLSRLKQEGPYLRGRIMDFIGSAGALSPDTHIELGLFDNTVYTNQQLAERAFVMAARQLLHMGFNPNITVHLLPRNVQYTSEFKEEMVLKQLSEI